MTDMFNETQLTAADLVGEGKKYKTAEDALNALVHSQKHIAKLEAEAQETARKLAEATTLDLAIARIKESNTPPPNSQTNQSVTTSVLDENTLNAKVEEYLTKKTEATRIADAKQLVQSTMLAKFQTAEKAKLEMAAKASELGMTAEQLDTLAVNSPKAFFQLFGIESKQTTGNYAPSKGNVNVQARIMNTPQTNGNAMDHYSNILRENRNLYMSPKIQNEIMAKAMENPSAFGINI